MSRIDDIKKMIRDAQIETLRNHDDKKNGVITQKQFEEKSKGAFTQKAADYGLKPKPYVPYSIPLNQKASTNQEKPVGQLATSADTKPDELRKMTDELRKMTGEKTVGEAQDQAAKEEARGLKSRIDAIDSELNRANPASSYLGQMSDPGKEKALLEERTRLSRELAEAARKGNHRERDVAALEKEAAVRETAAAQQYVKDGYAANPLSRNSQEDMDRYRNELGELDSAETREGTLEFVDKYIDRRQSDNFSGQFMANYDVGRMGQDSSLAWNEYINNPTRENRERAETIDKMIAVYTQQNAAALDEEGAVAPWITKTLANYVPQAMDQLKYQAGGAAVGALTMNPTGIKAGITAGSSLYAFQTMQGAAFRALLEAGVDEETARKAAMDEAVISGLLEMGDTALDLVTLGGGKAIDLLTGGGKIVAKEAAKKGAIQKLAPALMKYGINILGEGTQEGIQEGVSIANTQRKGSGIGNLTEEAARILWNAARNKEDPNRQQILEAGTEGAKLAAMLGLAEGGTNAVVNKTLARQQAIDELGAELAAMSEPAPEKSEAEQKLQDATDRFMGVNPEERTAQNQPKAAVDTADPVGYDEGNNYSEGAAEYGTGENGNSRDGRNTESNSGGFASQSAENGGGDVRTGNTGRFHGGNGEGTVYASDSEGRAVTPEVSGTGIKEQLRNNGEILNNMPISADIQVPNSFPSMSKNEKVNWIIEKLRPTNFEVDRKGFGIIKFAKKQIKSAFNYFKSGGIEEAAFEAVPFVLKNGQEIGRHDEHKGRSYGTVTIAAPVLINGKRGNMAVVVKKTTDNFYKVHRILTPNGTEFTLDFAEKEAEPTTAGELPKNGSLATPISSASENSISQSGAEVNGNPVQDSDYDAGIKGTGAAEQNFTGKAAYQDLLYEGNVQRDRPGDVRPMEVPKTDGNGRRVTEVAGNAYGAGIVSDATANTIEKMILDGELGFEKVTNRAALAAARRYIDSGNRSRQDVEGEIRKNIESGKVQDGDLEKAMLLFAEYAGNDDETSQRNAASTLLDIAEIARRAGRNLQLMKVLRQLTPEGQLATVQQSVNRYVDGLNRSRSQKDKIGETGLSTVKRKGKKRSETDPLKRLERSRIEVNKELAQKFLSAKTAEEKEAVLDEIYQDVAARIPGTLEEKVDAWRHLAMLMNPKTHLRNIISTGGFRPLSSAKRAVGAMMESAFVGRENRTKAILGPGRNSRELLKWAAEDAKSKDTQRAMKYTATTGDKARSRIDEYRKIFRKLTFLNGLSEWNTGAMEKEDMFFKRREYALSLASFLKARGYTAEAVSKGMVPTDVLAEGRAMAIQEAMKATFNDRNKLSDSLARLKPKGSSFGAKVGRMMFSGIAPYTRTPANVVVRIKEYSPLEFGTAISKAVEATREGKPKALTEAIDSFASALTGTGMIGLGAAMAAGWIPGILLHGEVSDEEREEGAIPYSLQVGDTYFSLSQFAPAAVPMLVGANLHKSVKEANTDGSIDGWDIAGILADMGSATVDPVVELSVLSGINDAIDNLKYEETGGDKAVAFATTAAMNYLTQFLPTILGQAEQAVENTKTKTFADGESSIERSVKSQLGKVTQRIPVVDAYQVTRRDALGQPVENEDNLLKRVFDAFANPFNTSKKEDDPVITEIMRVNREQEEKVVPPDVPKKVSWTDSTGERHTDEALTAEQSEKYADEWSSTVKTILKATMDRPDYKAMTEAQKARVIEKTYDYATERAKEAVLPNYHRDDEKWVDDIKTAPVSGIIARANASAVDSVIDDALKRIRNGWELKPELQKQADAIFDSFAGMSLEDKENILAETDSNTERFLEVRSKGVSTDIFLDAVQRVQALKPEGERATVSDVQKYEAIAQSDISDRAKDALILSYMADYNPGAKKPDTTELKYLYARKELGISPDVYVKLLRIEDGESGSGKKKRTVEKFEPYLKNNRSDAAKLYDMINGKRKPWEEGGKKPADYADNIREYLRKQE